LWLTERWKKGRIPQSMAKQAVIKLNGAQYIVSEGDTFEVKKTEKPEATVLMTMDGDKMEVGTPTLTGAKVDLSVAEQKRGEKMHVRRFRAKSRHRRRIGSRSFLTVLKVDKIS